MVGRKAALGEEVIDEDRRFLLTDPCAVPMNRVRFVDRNGSGVHRIGGLLVIDITRRYPPGTGDHVRVALELAENGWLAITKVADL